MLEKENILLCKTTCKGLFIYFVVLLVIWDNSWLDVWVHSGGAKGTVLCRESTYDHNMLGHVGQSTGPSPLPGPILSLKNRKIMCELI